MGYIGTTWVVQILLHELLYIIWLLLEARDSPVTIT